MTWGLPQELEFVSLARHMKNGGFIARVSIYIVRTLYNLKNVYIRISQNSTIFWQI